MTRVRFRFALLASAIALAFAALPAAAQDAGSEGPVPAQAYEIALQAADVPVGVNLRPAQLWGVGNCIPFGDNTYYWWMGEPGEDPINNRFQGFVYRNVPAFSMQPGDKIRFDLGAMNWQDTRRTIFFAAANVNPSGPYAYPGQGVRAATGWTQVASENELPLNPRGNWVVGDYELTYTAIAPFSFDGGGLIVGFQGSPPAAYADGGCDQVLAYTHTSDTSNFFYTRFYSRPDQYMGVLDGNPTGLIEGYLGGMIIEITNRPPAVAADSASVTADEGQDATNTGTFSDPDSDNDVTITASVGTVIKTGTNGGSWSWSIPTADGPAGPFEVVITADDGRGRVATTTFTYSVANVAPTVTGVAAGPAASCGAANAVTISFSDPALANDAYTATVDWGDGSAAETLAAAGFELGVSHAYAMAGLYTVTVTVADEDGGVSAPASAVAALDLTVVGGGVLPPVRQDGTSIFKYSSTIPVKAKFADCDGSLPGDLAVAIGLVQLSGNEPGGEINEPVSTSGADEAGFMRFSAADQQYIYNLATKPLPDPTASYQIVLTVAKTGQQVTAQFGLK